MGESKFSPTILFILGQLTCHCQVRIVPNGVKTEHIGHIFKSQKVHYSLSPGVWQSFVTIRSCNHLMIIILTYVDNTKKSEIS